MDLAISGLKVSALTCKCFYAYVQVDILTRDDMIPFRAWREDLDLTQKEAAERVDMTRAALS